MRMILLIVLLAQVGCFARREPLKYVDFEPSLPVEVDRRLIFRQNGNPVRESDVVDRMKMVPETSSTAKLHPYMQWSAIILMGTGSIGCSGTRDPVLKDRCLGVALSGVFLLLFESYRLVSAVETYNQTLGSDKNTSYRSTWMLSTMLSETSDLQSGNRPVKPGVVVGWQLPID